MQDVFIMRPGLYLRPVGGLTEAALRQVRRLSERIAGLADPFRRLAVVAFDEDICETTARAITELIPFAEPTPAVWHGPLDSVDYLLEHATSVPINLVIVAHQVDVINLTERVDGSPVGRNGIDPGDLLHVRVSAGTLSFVACYRAEPWSAW